MTIVILFLMEWLKQLTLECPQFWVTGSPPTRVMTQAKTTPPMRSFAGHAARPSVKVAMFSVALTHHKIFWPVVVFNSVNVVYNFTALQIAAKLLFHHKPMLQNAALNLHGMPPSKHRDIATTRRSFPGSVIWRLVGISGLKRFPAFVASLALKEVLPSNCHTAIRAGGASAYYSFCHSMFEVSWL